MNLLKCSFSLSFCLKYSTELFFSNMNCSYGANKFSKSKKPFNKSSVSMMTSLGPFAFKQLKIGCKYVFQNVKLQLNTSIMLEKSVRVSMSRNKSHVHSFIFKLTKQLRKTFRFFRGI